MHQRRSAPEKRSLHAATDYERYLYFPSRLRKNSFLAYMVRTTGTYERTTIADEVVAKSWQRRPAL
jgi:hypothetical protein